MTGSKAALILAMTLAGLSSASSAPDRAMRAEKMPFQACLALIEEVAGEFGTQAMRLQRTEDRHSARIQAADGVVTLVCSRTDQTVTLSRSTG